MERTADSNMLFLHDGWRLREIRHNADDTALQMVCVRLGGSTSFGDQALNALESFFTKDFSIEELTMWERVELVAEFISDSEVVVHVQEIGMLH